MKALKLPPRLAALFVAVLVSPAALASGGDLAVRAGVLHTGAGQSFSPGVVLIRDGKIAAVGPAGSVALPVGLEVVEAAVATPGLIDGRSVVGLSGAMNQPHDQDQLEHSAAIQPELRAIDAYNPREKLVGWLRTHGVTTIHTGHGPGEIISGQTMIIKTAGDTVEDAVIRPVHALSATLGAQAAQQHGRPSPGNRSKAVAMLREQLVKAEEYARQRENAEDDSKAPSRDLGLEALAQALSGELPLVVEVHRHNDIMTALRLAEEFDLSLVLAGASDAHMLVEQIKAAGVPVLLHPTMMRARGTEVQNFSFTTARKLLDAGIPVGLQGGFEDYVPKTRVVLFEAAMTLRYGLDFQEALGLVTSGPAGILNIDDRVGTLEVGKDGDLALFDGDPFEFTTRVTGTIVNGRQVALYEGEDL